MKQPAWDQQETALLIETYVRIINNLQPRKDSVSALSELLRSRARKKGLVIDAQFRNINGINLRLYELEYIFSDGQRGVSNTSLLFNWS